jgi:hypothetical protein
VANCSEANDALAFLITLTLDPDAALKETRAATPGPARQRTPNPTIAHEPSGPGPASSERRSADSTDAAKPAPQRTADPASTTDPAKPTEPRTGDSTPASRDPAPQAEPRVSAATLAGDPAQPEAATSPALQFERIELSLIAQLAVGVAPSAMPGFGLQALAALRGSGMWAPALQLRATRAWLDGWAAAGGSADFRLDSARLDLCPLGWRWRMLTGRACLAGALGSLAAAGSRSFGARSQSRLWVDAGATLTLAADLGRLLQVRVNTGLALPARRDRYAFGPDVFHRVSAVCWQGDIGVGLRFP